MDHDIHMIDRPLTNLDVIHDMRGFQLDYRGQIPSTACVPCGFLPACRATTVVPIQALRFE